MRPLSRSKYVKVLSLFAASLTAITALAACGSSDSSEPGSSTASGSSDGVSADVTAAVKADYAGTNEQPPAEGPAPAKGVNLWVITCSAQAPGCQAPAAKAVEAGKLLGWKVTVGDGNFGIGDGYNTAIRQALAAGADAIDLIGIQCSAAQASLQQAKTAGIPVIGTTSFDDCSTPLFAATTQMNSAHPELEDWLKAYGAAKANWLIEATGGKAKVITSSMANNLTANLPQEGFDAELRANCPDCTIVDTVKFTDQDLSTGGYKQKFATSVVAHPEADSVVAVLDTFVLAANMPATIASAGRKITLVGGEGLAPVTEMVRGGQVGAQTAWDNGWLGYAAVDTVNRVLNKQPSIPQGFGWQTVDSTHNLPAKGATFAAPVDYVSAYKKLWGVS